MKNKFNLIYDECYLIIINSFASYDMLNHSQNLNMITQVVPCPRRKVQSLLMFNHALVTHFIRDEDLSH